MYERRKLPRAIFSKQELLIGIGIFLTATLIMVGLLYLLIFADFGSNRISSSAQIFEAVNSNSSSR